MKINQHKYQQLLSCHYSQAQKYMAILLTIITLLITTVYFCIRPYHNQYLHLIQHQNQLKHQFASQYQQWLNWQNTQNLQHQLNTQYASNLKQLQQNTNTPQLIRQIITIAKGLQLTIDQIQPLPLSSYAGLQQQNVDIKLSGQEASLRQFLAILAHQPWPIIITELQLQIAAKQVQLHTIITVYYHCQECQIDH